MVLSIRNMSKEAKVPKSRGALGTGVTYVEPAVNRQPGFRRELVEQITLFVNYSQNFLYRELLKYKFPDPGVFLPNFHENSKFS